jgi:hypothetical protein
MSLDDVVNAYAAVAAPAILAAEAEAADRRAMAAHLDRERDETITLARAQAKEGGR